MLEDIKKGDIKKVNKVGDKIIIELGYEVEILAEKEKISKIAEMDKIKLE